MLREAPIGLQAAFGHVGNRQAGHRTFGFRTRPAESGISVRAPPPAEPGASAPGSFGQDRASARELRNGGPRMQVHGPPGGTEASAEDPAGRGTGASAEEPPGWEAGRKFQICRAANRQGFGPVGEPAGKPEGASASDGPRRKRRRGPRSRRRPLETARRGTPRLPGKVPATGQWGPAATPAPINFRGQSSRCRPVSRHGA
jgi:hypothetical protein